MNYCFSNEARSISKQMGDNDGQRESIDLFAMLLMLLLKSNNFLQCM